MTDHARKQLKQAGLSFLIGAFLIIAQRLIMGTPMPVLLGFALGTAAYAIAFYTLESAAVRRRHWQFIKTNLQSSWIIGLYLLMFSVLFSSRHTPENADVRMTIDLISTLGFVIIFLIPGLVHGWNMASSGYTPQTLPKVSRFLRALTMYALVLWFAAKHGDQYYQWVQVESTTALAAGALCVAVLTLVFFCWPVIKQAPVDDGAGLKRARAGRE